MRISRQDYSVFQHDNITHLICTNPNMSRSQQIIASQHGHIRIEHVRLIIRYYNVLSYHQIFKWKNLQRFYESLLQCGIEIWHGDLFSRTSFVLSHSILRHSRTLKTRKFSRCKEIGALDLSQGSSVLYRIKHRADILIRLRYTLVMITYANQLANASWSE